jgi:adenylate cyclase
MASTRRLAAILAADVVGYSRLMGSDESGTLQALKTIRAELIDPTIAAHNGRLVKTTGDGLLVEFSGVVDALRATEVQAGMAERNTAVPNDRRIDFRIGINMGDIVVEDGDIFGDGVNVAPGLKDWQSLAAFASRRGCRKTPWAASTLPSKTSASRR